MNAIAITPGEYGHAREELASMLDSHGIETRKLFTGMHNQPSLKAHGCDCSGSYPVTDDLAENGLYLPSASNLPASDIDFVSGLIREFHR
jgi:perosamine synthetase